VSATRVITLPHGLWDGRRRRSAAELRPPPGADEAYLLSAGGLSRAEQITGLLGRCVVRVDELPAGDDLARALTVGDREALLLHLRADAFGDSLACTLDCPECGERMDVDLRVSDLLVAPYAEVRDRHEVELDVDGVRREAVVRLATGADQEAVAGREDQAAGLEELVERCLLELRAADTPPPLALAEALSDPLAGLDPQAEITIDAVCPSCGESLSALVDAASVLFAELTVTDERLFREVDAIARVYHWGEDEILGLDVHRRRRYLELLAENEFETEAEGP
jgi:hypothetical protein